MGRLEEMGKTIALVVFVVLLLVWAVWDQFAHWITMVHGDCNGHWFMITCSRCGYTETKLDLHDLPKHCPKCSRRMR